MRHSLSNNSSRMTALWRTGTHYYRTVNPNNNAKLLLSRSFSSSNSSNGGGSWRQHLHQSSLSSFWFSALGSCVALQLYETQRHYNQTTWMEEAPSDSNDNEDNSYAKEKKEERKKKKPWYRRYPTDTLERLRSSYKTAPKEPSKPQLDNSTQFYGQCLQRQLWQPQVPYPAWDYNWDGKMEEPYTLENMSTAQGLVSSGKTGTTRHILLIRHGQYEEEPFDDQKRCLTPLGKRQAQLTGRRMATLVKQINASNDNTASIKGKARINAIHTSDLLRAKQTAWILAQALPPVSNVDGSTETEIPISNPDPDLNEGLPAPMIPPRPDLPGVMEEVDEQQERMERAFHRYFYRADPSPELVQALRQRIAAGTQQPSSDYNFSATGTFIPTMHSSTSGSIAANNPSTSFPNNAKLPPPDHEFDIIVCHGNIIRYFLCRALQLPPEAWLRLSVFNCSVSYIMIKPNGYVSCRMIGDIGHLGYRETTFSGAHGLLWS